MGIGKTEISFIGDRVLVENFRSFSTRAFRSVHAEVFDIGNDVVNRIKLGMRSTPKTGRTYQSGSVSHTSSSPGNYPAIDTGNLVNHIIANAKKSRLEIGVLEGAPYGKFLELGTRNMEPRPFLQPAVGEEDIPERIAAAVERTVRRKA